MPITSIVQMTPANWLSVVIGLIVGLVFFMFGMNVMSGNLEKMSGGKLERTLKTATSNPLISIFLGAAITIAVQSSSATTVMLVGLVNSGLMTMSQTLYVIYGANIGTTFTSWILSMSGIDSGNIGILMLKPENFAPVLALIGTVMVMMSKKDQRKSIGTVLIGFAVLIYGMEMMGDAVKPPKSRSSVKHSTVRAEAVDTVSSLVAPHPASTRTKTRHTSRFMCIPPKKSGEIIAYPTRLRKVPYTRRQKYPYFSQKRVCKNR